MTATQSSMGNLGGFTLDFYQALRGGDGVAAAKAMAMAVAAGPLLSPIEQRSLMTLAKSLGGDGAIDADDAATLMHMVSAYAGDGERALENYWPFRTVDFDRAPGNRLFSAAVGVLAGRITENLHDISFLQAAQALLESSGGNGRWKTAVADALANTDLSKLSAGERAHLLSSMAIAGGDGHMSRAECAALLRQLSRYSGEPYQAPAPLPGPAWTATTGGNGTAHIDLGNYTLDLDERSSQFILTNKESGEQTRVWGDPHFDAHNDGQNDVTFYGALTLHLEDGTQVTVNTTPFDANTGVTLSSQLVITRGDQSMVVNGLDQNQLGDLSITQGRNGNALDAVFGNGLNVYESGHEWQVQDGPSMRTFAQADGDATKGKAGNEFRPSLMASMIAFGSMAASTFLLGMILSASRRG